MEAKFLNDTGTGIPKEHIGDLKNKFNQFNNSLDGIKSGANFGSGIGLTNTNLILHLMNSEIQIESTEGKGSYFYFDVTCFKEVDAFKESKKIKKVLSVDDNAINQQVLTMILKSLKLEVDNAENAQIAVDMVKDNDYDLILMDIQMPVMDGIEATKIIRDDLKKETPILAVTAMSVENKETFLLNNKLNDYIAKPVNK